MNLELKHLAAYLPYGLNGKYILSSVIKLSDSQKDEIRDCNLMEENVKFFRIYCKPILRPLSDLTKEIEHNGENFVPIDELLYKMKLEVRGLSKFVILNTIKNEPFIIEHWAFEKLVEWHFDVFGLIDEGFALPLI